MEKPMNTKEAAEYLNASPATVKSWRFLGKGPKFCKPMKGRGGRVWYFKEDLDAWLRNGND